MDTHINARIDAHELQIKQLQSDITEIKSTLKLLEADRAESAEFRKVFLGWMKQQEKTNDEASSGPGFRGEVLSGFDQKSEPHIEIDSISDTFQSNLEQIQPASSVVAAILSRSTEHSNSHGNLMSVRVKGAMSDATHRKLDSQSVVGHGVALNLPLDPNCPDLSPKTYPSHQSPVGTVLPLVFLPFDQGKHLIPVLRTRLF